MENHRYDAHCHIFTLKYILKEVKSLLHDILLGTYPWHDPKAKALLTAGRRIADIKAFLRQLYELVRAAADTEEENLNFLQNEAKQVYPSESLRIVPLMMDVFYMFGYSLDKDQDSIKTQALKAGFVNEKLFQEQWDEVLDDFTRHVNSLHSSLKGIALKATSAKAGNVLKIIEEERSVKSTLKMKTPMALKASSTRFYQTEGFCFHMDNLRELVKKRRGELYPFIAIDPRRPGMIDELLTGSFFTNNGGFYGVKLYPRMGYHPQCAPMDAVYKYCSDHNLPIIFHCGMSGFPPGVTWKYADFGNPIHFEPVVKKYPELKIVPILPWPGQIPLSG
jgi:hypothetical protein